MAKKFAIKDYESIGVFLIMELVALVSFCLGGTVIVFHYVGFVVSLLAFFFAYQSYDKKELKSLILIGAPIIVLAICLAFGNLYGGFSNFLANFGVFLAIPSFFLVGMSARRTKNLSIENVLLCLGFGAALLVLISLVITYAQYGMFYTLIYKNTPAYYYEGNLYNVTKEMSWLNGFKVNEVSLKYAGLFGVLLCSALPALMFIDPKANTKKFVMVASIGVVGLLSIVTIVNLTALIFLIPVLVIALVYRFLRDNKKFWKVATWIFEVIFGFAIAALIFAFLNALVPGVHNFTSGNAVLNRLFNTNRIMAPFNNVVGAMFKSFNLFGFPVHSAADIEGKNSDIIFADSGIFELEIIKEGGFFALLAFLMILVVMFISISKYYLERSKDSHAVKVSLLCFVVSFFLYSSFAWENAPFTHSDIFLTVGRSFPFLILLFVLGLMYFPLMKEEPIFNTFERKSNSNADKKEVEYLDKDYVFTDANKEEVVDDGKDNIVV